MAYDEELAERVRRAFEDGPAVVERKMFGGLGFLIAGNMACAVMRDELIVRVPPEEVEGLVASGAARPFGRLGARPMKGFVQVDAGDDLETWVRRGADRALELPAKS